VDEAHSLMKAHSLYEKRLKKQDVERAIEEVDRYLPNSSLVKDLLNEIGRIIDLLSGTVGAAERHDKAILSRVLGEIGALQDAAEEVSRAKIEEALLSGAVQSPRSYMVRLVSWLSILAIPDSFLFVERDENGEIVLVATPIDPSIAVREPLERAVAAVLLSGTMPRGDYVRELLGVQKPVKYLDAEMLFGPFIPPRNIYAAVARNVTTRYRERSPSMYRTLAVYVGLIARLMPGAKLAVYPSYDLMRTITDRLPAGLPMIIEEKKTSITDVREALRENPDTLINAVADGKLVEGVEFVVDGENLLTTVVMVGVPFPQPDIYTMTKLQVLSARLGRRRADYYVFLFSALVKVKQALGRATRGPDDRAAYFLLDYRYLRRDIRESLRVPIRRVFSSVDGLRLAIGEARRVVGEDRALYSSSSRKDSSAS